jgi:site-specific DNA-cytosine methylase
MRHGSLFSGIGGFDLAAEWMGWENVFHCEWMEFPRKVLDYYFPNADSHIDICKTDFKKYEGTIDIISGGFPCQPFSLAGKRKGTEDERYLWGEMLRAVQEIKPKFVIAENVFGITNIDGGMVFEQVCLDLETEGYEVQPFIIPAAAKNAPHRRDRVWFIATITASFGERGGNLNPESNHDTEKAMRIAIPKLIGMLPTPCTRDYKGDRKLTDGKNITQNGEEMGLTLEQTARILVGKSEESSKNSQLNPRFVAEMMGFPPNWTELPFLNGEQNQLKDTETP